MNISVYHMLQSCGVQAWRYPETEVKNETHIPGLKRVTIDFEILVSIFLYWTIIND